MECHERKARLSTGYTYELEGKSSDDVLCVGAFYRHCNNRHSTYVDDDVMAEYIEMKGKHYGL